MSRFGLMDPDTKDNGRTTWLKVMEGLPIKMVTSMKASGNIIMPMVMVFLLIKKDRSMKVTGRKMSQTGKGGKIGKMGAFIRGSIKME